MKDWCRENPFLVYGIIMGLLITIALLAQR